MRIFTALFMSMASIFLSIGAVAAGLPDLNGPVLLTITAADGTQVEFDRARLEALEWRQIETHTSFTDGPQTFAGATLSSVLAQVDIREGTLEAQAVNGYTVLIPVAHAAAHDVLLAMDWNGRAMRVRTKGPIWVVYPLSAREAAGQPFDAEMIWQLTGLRQRD